MPTMKLTRRALAAIEPSAKPVVYWDADIAGLGLSVRPSGARSWVVRYRAGAGGRTGTLRQVVIGNPETMTPEQARSAAKDILANVRLGADPAAERAEARAADTISEIAAEWLSRHVEPKRKEATAKLYRAVLGTHILPAIGSRKAVTLTRLAVSRSSV